MKTRMNAICHISMCLLGIYISVYQNQINAISSEYSLSDTFTGVIVSLHFIGCLITPVICGEIGDRVGKKAMVIAAFMVFNTGLFLIYICKDITLMSIGVFLIGSGFAVIEGMLTSALSDNNAGHTSRVINLSQMFFCIGAISGPMLALAFSDIFNDWKPIFAFLLIMFSIIMFLVCFMEIGGSHKPVKAGSGLITFRLLKDRFFVILCISIFLYVGIEGGVAFWTTTYFERVFGAKQLGTYALSGYWGSMIIGRYLASRFENRYDLFMKMGLFISLFFVIAALVSANPIVGLMCFIGIGFGFSALWPIMVSLALKKYSSCTGTAIGILITFSASGGIVVPFIIGFITGISTLKTAFIIIPFITLLIIFLQFKLTDTKQHQEKPLET